MNDPIARLGDHIVLLLVLVTLILLATGVLS